jgi:xylan 1,4-beta-xylosidase
MAGLGATAHALPNGYAWGCLNISKALPFCDPKLPVQARVSDLLSRLTLEEKLLLMGPDTVDTGVGSCDCMDAGIKRFGVPNYMNLVETNSAVAAECLGENKCATNFPGPMNLGSSFNRTLWRRKGEVISTEMRALNNLNWYRGVEAPHSFIGLTGYGPNINIARDPRFGRISELPGEDPLHSGSYAMEYVKGMQEGPDPRYFKMVAGLKHFDAYSVEDNRSSRMFNISQFDLFDTYLYQYKMGFHPSMGNAGAAMCSYAGVNGVPSCAHDYLLNEVVRGHWERPDALIVSDCGALANMQRFSHYAKDMKDAAAKALLGGCDVDLGDGLYSLVEVGGMGSLLEAYAAGMVNTGDIDTAIGRILLQRFRTGLFDPIEDQPYMKYGAQDVNSTDAHALVLDGALQGLVLLKNEKGLLPLTKGTKIAVLGPHVNSTRDLFEDYMGDQVCVNGTLTCVQTIGATFQRLNGKENTHVCVGVGLNNTNTSLIGPALDMAKDADVVLLFIGDGNEQEHEGIDRPNTLLPGLQESFAEQVLALGKPTVIVMINGGMVSIDNIAGKAQAIVEAFNPGLRGAEALFLSLFGEANRWGRLPVTIYPMDYTDQVDMYSFDMTAGPGRTYRYYKGDVMFPFGAGISYTTFALTCDMNPAVISAGGSAKVECQVKNTGDRAGDDVIMVYHAVDTDIAAQVDHPVPLRQLVAFERVSLDVGEAATVTFAIGTDQLTLTNNDGDRVLYSGAHLFSVSDGTNEEGPLQLTVQGNRFRTVVERVPRP